MADLALDLAPDELSLCQRAAALTQLPLDAWARQTCVIAAASSVSAVPPPRVDTRSRAPESTSNGSSNAFPVQFTLSANGAQLAPDGRPCGPDGRPLP